MSILVNRPSCAHLMRITELAVGRIIRCDKCQTSIRVPIRSSRSWNSIGGVLMKIKSFFGLR
jgi:hypothetical protein